ncbi:MAG: phosphodiesterase [Hyphomicrobiales bacterium]|nr:MAG: phosphodiesterase [Hyphomicrobiales bacterium]
MLIAQITDTHIKMPGKLAYKMVDTAGMLRTAIEHLVALPTQPDLIVHTGDLVDFGTPQEYAYIREILAPLQVELIVIPGNHDERGALAQAFADGGYLPTSGFLNFCIRRGPLAIVGLDTVVPGQGGGKVCAERLSWLEQTLAANRDVPTLVLMHHPPFATGIAHMDAIGLEGRDEFAAIVARHRQIQAILCGHVHRSINALVGGRLAMISPSVAHQVALDLTPDGPSAFRMEPPGYMLHKWDGNRLVSHVAVIGGWPGPFPFFDADGRLID